MKKILFWVIFIILFIWQLPQNLVALIMMPFLGKLTLRCERKYCFCFTGEKMSGGISLGNFAFVSKYLANHDESVAHEVKGHTFDSKLFGPLYLLIIGLPSILNACFDFTKCYYDFFPEKWANKHAGLETEECRLKFKDGEEL